MAYIPPHKRHHTGKPSPSPSSPVPRFEGNLNLRSKFAGSSDWHNRNDKHVLAGGKIIYAKDSISRWLAVGLTDDDQFPSSFELKPYSCELIERKNGEKPLVLACTCSLREAEESMRSVLENPWVYITEKIQADLLTSLENVRAEMEFSKPEEVKPSLVARFGKILFHGGPSISLDTIRTSYAAETGSKNRLKKMFYTNVPDAYMEAIESVVVPRIGIDFEAEKEYYNLKISDKSQPDATISCKCNKRNDSGLELQKIELNPVRHLLADISCLEQNLDLRLMLITKRILRALTDEEQHSIGELVKSAIIDPDVKGGVRWPLGRESAGDRFSILGVWHTKSKAFKCPKMRLKLRHADRFDFRSSTGETSREVILKLTGVSRKLMAEAEDCNSAMMETFQETLKLVWNEFMFDP